MHKSYRFKDDNDLMDFIQKEVRKYTGQYSDDNRVLFAYNRLTVEELSQEVALRLLRAVTPDGPNKTYVRQAVIYVCIDEYRRYRVYDLPSNSPEEQLEDDTLVATERVMQLKIFNPKELEVVKLLMEGHRNPQVREILKIPKMTYYTLLARIKVKYIEELNTVVKQEVVI